jgi:PTS system cellobiose-specific IIB component
MSEEKKIRVLMVCAMGMSSSLIEAKTAKAAEAAGVPFELKAIEAAEMGRWDFSENPMDIVLVAPQVRFKKKAIEQASGPYGTIVLNIDTVAYGMIDGEAIFNQVMEAIHERDAGK